MQLSLPVAASGNLFRGLALYLRTVSYLVADGVALKDVAQISLLSSSFFYLMENTHRVC